MMKIAGTNVDVESVKEVRVREGLKNFKGLWQPYDRMTTAMAETIVVRARNATNALFRVLRDYYLPALGMELKDFLFERNLERRDLTREFLVDFFNDRDIGGEPFLAYLAYPSGRMVYEFPGWETAVEVDDDSADPGLSSPEPDAGNRMQGRVENPVVERFFNTLLDEYERAFRHPLVRVSGGYDSYAGGYGIIKNVDGPGDRSGTVTQEGFMDFVERVARATGSDIVDVQHGEDGTIYKNPEIEVFLNNPDLEEEGYSVDSRGMVDYKKYVGLHPPGNFQMSHNIKTHLDVSPVASVTTLVPFDVTIYHPETIMGRKEREDLYRELT